MMNYEEPLNHRARRIARREKCIADLCYPLIKFDIEYLGEYDHDNKNAFSDDRARVNGLQEMGYEVVELTYDQVVSFGRFESIVQMVAKKLDVYLKPQVWGSRPERSKLRRLGFAWNRAFGEPSKVSY